MARPVREPAIVMTPEELRDLLVDILADATDRSKRYWRNAIGEVEMLPLTTNVRSNWEIKPTGSPEDLETIAKAVDIVRPAHPYVG